MNDIPDLEARLRALAAAPHGGDDWADVLRRAGEGLRVRSARRRFALVLVAAAVAAVAAAAVLTLGGHGSSRTVSPGPGVGAGPTGLGLTSHGGPTGATGRGGAAGPGDPYVHTLAEPLPDGERVSLREAADALGVPIMLPDTPQASRSDVGAVWLDRALDGARQHGTYRVVAVTFPSRDLMIDYEQPELADPLDPIQYSDPASPGTQISLNGVQAEWIPRLPDGSGWDSITFTVRGSTIVVASHRGEAFLKGIAQSIVDRAQSQ